MLGALKRWAFVIIWIIWNLFLDHCHIPLSSYFLIILSLEFISEFFLLFFFLTWAWGIVAFSLYGFLSRFNFSYFIIFLLLEPYLLVFLHSFIWHNFQNWLIHHLTHVDSDQKSDNPNEVVTHCKLQVDIEIEWRKQNQVILRSQKDNLIEDLNSSSHSWSVWSLTNVVNYIEDWDLQKNLKLEVREQK